MNAVVATPAVDLQPLDAPATSGSAGLEPAACCGLGMRHSAPMQAQQHVFRTGDALGDFYIVRSGSYKCYWVDRRGQEYITGFRFPGEPLGLNAIFSGRYPHNAVALETSTVWFAPYAELRRQSALNDRLRAQFFRLIGQEMANAAVLACDYTAEERIAKFLLDVAQRFARRGYSATSFHLSMSRRDIANHLRLATETVTRVLTRFQEQRLIKVDRRLLSLLDTAQLQHFCASMGGVAIERTGSEAGETHVPPPDRRFVPSGAAARIC